MNAEIRRKMTTGFTALTFSKANPEESAGFAATLKGLEELVVRGNGLATQQRSGIISERTASARKRELKSVMTQSHLNHLSRVAVGAGAARPDLPGKFRQPRENGSFQAFRTAARAMAAEAEANKEVLVSHGLSELVLADLMVMLDQFDAEVEAGARGRRDHVGAGAELEVVVQDIMHAVRVLDGLNRVRFANDAEKLAAWESASNVLATSRTSDGVPTPGPEPVHAEV